MAPKAMKIAMKPMKAKAKAMKAAMKPMKAKTLSAAELKKRKRQRDVERVRDQSGGYSRVEERRKLEEAEADVVKLKAEKLVERVKLETAEAEIVRLKAEAVAGVPGCENFQRAEADYGAEGWYRGCETAQGRGGGGAEVRQRKKDWVVGFVEGHQKERERMKKEEEEEAEPKRAADRDAA
jgi:hypothetical protein